MAPSFKLINVTSVNALQGFFFLFTDETNTDGYESSAVLFVMSVVFAYFHTLFCSLFLTYLFFHQFEICELDLDSIMFRWRANTKPGWPLRGMAVRVTTWADLFMKVWERLSLLAW